jgi:D-alanine-D-alanine ligase-like ATP-grasp enzyme
LTIQADAFASYKLLATALKKKGYTVEVGEEHPTVVTFTSPEGVSWQTKAAHIAYPFNSQEARATSIHKSRAYELARSAQFSIPATVEVGKGVSEAVMGELLATYKKLIVKPDDLSLAKGLTINITSIPQLKKAIAYAHTFSASALIQQQVTGEEVRFTVINGRVEAALLRRTARVIGDGRSSIARLVEHENEERRSLELAYITYPQLDEKLVDASLLGSSTVPTEGEIVELNHSTMIRGGCSVYNILPEVDVSYIKLVEGLVAKLDAGFIVVDVFCRSFTSPATADNHWLIELNTAPVLKLYYSCRDGKQFDIVDRLATAIDEWQKNLTD